MIHYHGTPITPKTELYNMRGRHFCTSFAHPADAEDCLAIGQSNVWDNGGYPAFTQGKPITDWNPFYAWVEPKLGHPNWGVVPDVIGGSVEEQRALVKQWPFGKRCAGVVWHMNMPIEYLLELIDAGWGYICFGSAGEYWQVGADAWRDRAYEAFNCIVLTFQEIPWVHMLRGLNMRGQEFPFASGDSTNVGMNYRRNFAPAPKGCAEIMAREIDGTQCPLKWEIRATQRSLLDAVA